MDWAELLSSHGLATVIVIAGGVGLVMVARWFAPLIRDLFGVAQTKLVESVDAHNRMVETLSVSTEKSAHAQETTASAIEGIAITLDGHGAILREHSDRLHRHEGLLLTIHEKVHGKTP